MDEARIRTILLVDDEHNITRSIKRVLRPLKYNVLIANSGDEALQLLKEHEVQVMVSDQLMPKMTGSELFEKVEEKHPRVVRILLTGYTAIEGITSAVNKGAVYRVLFKPWDDDHLISTIKDAFKTYDVVEENRQLTMELQEFNKNLEHMVEKKTRELTINVKRLHTSHRLFDNLPAFAMGISDDHYIVEANLKAQMAFGGTPVIGMEISSVLPEELFKLVEATSSNDMNQSERLRYQFGEISYNFTCSRFEIDGSAHAFLLYGSEINE